MNPKIASLAVELGHLNASSLKDLIVFIRSGESVENIAETPNTAPPVADNPDAAPSSSSESAADSTDSETDEPSDDAKSDEADPGSEDTAPAAK